MKTRFFSLLRVLVAGMLTVSAAVHGQGRVKVRSVQAHNTTYVFLRDIATLYGLSYRPKGKEVSLASNAGELSFCVDQRVAEVNRVKIHLSFAPALWQKQATISETDLRLLIDPILRPAGIPQQPARVIMLDAGHGGRDHGTHGKLYKEKTLTLQVAQKLAAKLRKCGFKVVLTRNDDRLLTLAQRSALARSQGADLFISLHANFTKSRTVKGIETFFLAPSGSPSTYGAKNLAKRSPGNAFDHRNTRLAYDIQKNLVKATGASDRGIKHAQFAVLNEAPCPAVLVELGFLSHAQEETSLGSSSYQDRLAQGLMQGVADFQRCLVAGRQARR
jgi:N-acetylmuramoyl-L-alanine amidase